jgi:hypothetical protein
VVIRDAVPQSRRWILLTTMAIVGTVVVARSFAQAVYCLFEPTG